ncbi:MAG TPA: histidinol dehydrogenase, partial [Treponemataceae bacterium]|nr:histidinol dehydrogenase [Treponemataceae bacterium]
MQEANEYLKIVTKSDLPDSFYSSRRLSSSLDTVSGIVEQVRLHGDQAVHEYASRFDKADPDTFELPAEALKDAEIKLQHEAPELYSALVRSRDLALTFAVRQKESFSDFETMLSPGMVTGQRIIPVQRAGVYVPAGRFPLFSSVIMGSAPAQAAGVEEIILCTPPIPHPGNRQSGGQSGDGRPWGDEKILAVASLCGINRVFAIGGAQAIAAMAYGTESVPAVNVIVGPGNRFVSAAK